MKRWNKITGRYEPFSPGERKYPILPTQLASQFADIAPTLADSITYHPCRIMLNNGKVVDCVYLVEAQLYIRVWGVWPDQDAGKSEISVLDVARIEPSPFRLPSPLAERLYAAGESGMGYFLFEVLYNDGSRSSHISGNAVDFINLPPGMTMADVKDVIPHSGRDTRGKFEAPEYSWCLFENG